VKLFDPISFELFPPFEIIASTDMSYMELFTIISDLSKITVFIYVLIKNEKIILFHFFYVVE